MMGRQTGDQSQLFYLFNLEDRIPASRLLRRINPVVTRVLNAQKFGDQEQRVEGVVRHGGSLTSSGAIIRVPINAVSRHCSVNDTPASPPPSQISQQGRPALSSCKMNSFGSFRSPNRISRAPVFDWSQILQLWDTPSRMMRPRFFKV